MHYRGGRAAIDRDVYPDLERVLGRPDAAYAEEVRRLGALGCTLPAVRRHEPRVPQRPAPARDVAEHRRRPRAPAPRSTSATSTRRSRAGPRAWRSRRTCAAATTVPRGSAAGGYDFVAEALFNELEVDGFFLEYDDERSGGFEPLRFVPQGQDGGARPRDHQARRAGDARTSSSGAIEEAAQYVPLEQLCLSPQCGFASTVEGNASPTRSRSPSCASWSRSPQEIWGARAARSRAPAAQEQLHLAGRHRPVQAGSPAHTGGRARDALRELRAGLDPLGHDGQLEGARRDRRWTP